MAVCVQAFLYTWSKAELQNTSIRLSTSSNRVKDTACQMPVFSLPSHHVQSRPGVPKQAWLRPTLPCSQQGPVPRTLPGRALFPALFPAGPCCSHHQQKVCATSTGLDSTASLLPQDTYSRHLWLHFCSHLEWQKFPFQKKLEDKERSMYIVG